MNTKKLKAKNLLGNRLTRQERFLLDLFGSTPKNSLVKKSSRESALIIKTSTPTISEVSSRSINNSTEQDTSSSNSSNSSKSRSSSLTRITSPFDIPASIKSSWLTVSPTSSRSPSPQPTQAPTSSWKLIPLDLSPIKFTRPPAHRLHHWDRRVRRALSPRYKEDKENHIPIVKLNSKERRKERRRFIFNKI